MNEKFFEGCDLELVNSTSPFTKDASTGESASHFVRLCSFAPIKSTLSPGSSRFFNMAADKVAFYVKLLQIELTCLVKQGLCGLFS